MAIVFSAWEVPHFLIVHLFSGRRRHGGYSWASSVLGIAFGLPSDSAFAWYSSYTSCWGPAHAIRDNGPNWLTCIKRDWWQPQSADHHVRLSLPARHHVPEVEPGKQWPRPLRSAERLLGLPALTMKELRQLSLGSEFALPFLLEFGLLPRELSLWASLEAQTGRFPEFLRRSPWNRFLKHISAASEPQRHSPITSQHDLHIPWVPCMLYMVTFTINIPQMLAIYIYIIYTYTSTMDPMGIWSLVNTALCPYLPRPEMYGATLERWSNAAARSTSTPNT